MAVEWNKYVGLPFKHLGIDPTTGIDCFNLINYIYKEELGIEIPYATRDYCNIIDEYWYVRSHTRYIDEQAIPEFGWKKTNNLEEFNVITMMLGSSTVTNHCALYIGNNKILHIIQNHKSHIATYGNYYKQYTMGIYKWIGTKT